MEVVVQKTQIKQIAQFVILAKLMSGTGHPRRQFIPKAARLSSRAAFMRQRQPHATEANLALQ
jgi:hypothetical protein